MRKYSRRAGARSQTGRGSPRFPIENQGPSSVALSYRGPIWDGAYHEQRVTRCHLLFATANLNSTAGGVIATVISSSSVTFSNFAAYANIYDEFRVLGMQLEYFPANRYSKTTTVCMPGIGVVDRNDSTPLSAPSILYESTRQLSLEDPWTDRSEYRGSSVPALHIRMEGAEEAQWLSTGSTAAELYVKLYFSGLTASTTYGVYYVRALVQFRGQG